MTADSPRLALRGLLAVVPTPFHDDGSLDLPGFHRLVEAYARAGASALTVLGVMGEASELEDSERRSIVEGTREAAPGFPVIVGVTADRADAVRARAHAAVAAGATALMVSASHGASLDQAVTAAAEGGVPIVIQDHPASSGVEGTAEEFAAVAGNVPLVAGVKVESPPTVSTIAALRTIAPELDVVGGLGALFLIDELRAGAAGAMTGAAIPDRLADVIRRFRQDSDGAERMWLSLLPVLRLEAFAPFNLVARKEIWRLRGVIGSSRCRWRGARLDDEARASVRRALDSLEPLEAVGSSV